MDTQFIRNRLIELINKKGVSDAQMSRELGYNKGYITEITSGRAMPTMGAFLKICDYFHIQPSEFFYTEGERSVIVSRTEEDFMSLSEEDKLVLSQIIQRLKSKK